MLKTLLKYDLIYYKRKLLPIYAALIIAAPIVHYLSRALENMNNAAFYITFVAITGITYFLTFSVIMLTVYILWRRFSQIMNTTDGYLIHTLPVSAHKILISQYINSIIWIFASVVVFSVSFIMLIYGITNISSGILSTIEFINNITNLLSSPISPLSIVASYLNTNSTNLTANLILITISTAMNYFAVLSILYASVCIGQLFKKHKVLAGIVVFFVITIIVSFINGVMSLFINIPGLAFDTSVTYYNLIASLILSIAISVAMVVALYFIMYYIIKNKLNMS